MKVRRLKKSLDVYEYALLLTQNYFFHISFFQQMVPHRRIRSKKDMPPPHTTVLATPMPITKFYTQSPVPKA